jgi:hypothetical protein
VRPQKECGKTRYSYMEGKLGENQSEEPHQIPKRNTQLGANNLYIPENIKPLFL